MSDTSFTDNPQPPLPDRPEENPPPPLQIKRRGWPLWLVATHIGAFLFGYMLACGLGGLRTVGGANSIAIMPFAGEWRPPNANKDWAEKYKYFIEVSLPDSIAKDLVAHAAPGTIKVIATHEVRDRKLPEKSPQQIGKDLEVAAVLSGRVSPDGQLTLQLIAVKTGELLWSNTFNLTVGPGGGPNGLDFNSQGQITQNVMQKLRGRGL